ncbi:ABC-2 type transport system permease protein [Geosporobacter subterraneus DSM 17957]|uniref:ABC-2 type transport system permease protein n=1 Tax=Geosporobacter subterraneus DSM 17957 TaxID=1121919 RepID=A0A1M6EW26_9FIRM|nr:ABC transporter permease [Geosporobacter subterraneus]SHI89600.1 ABC-2 type transport system permease protein [Geosporobacter subterraneus DSM 17957]
MNLHRFMAIVRKEFIHIRRDKASMMIALAAPLLMLFLFGYAVKLEVERVDMAVFDQDHSAQSRALVQKLKHTDYFIDRYYAGSDREVIEMVDKGIVKVGLIIPPDFERLIKGGKEAQVQFLIDGSDATTARTALSSTMLLSSDFGRDIREEMLKKAGPLGIGAGGIRALPRVLYNPAMESIKFTIPGLIGLVIQNITIILTAFSLVRERERGTLEQLIITPIRPIELILGKLIPYILIGFFDFALVMILAMTVFRMEVRGSMLMLLLFSACFVICALAMGMIISTIAKTQLQAMQMALLLLLPSVLLSGFVFPREAMPKPIYLMGFVMPLTYYLQIIRGIVLKGVGVDALRQQTGLLLFFTFLLIFVAVMRFKKRLD